ncbi:MAG: hypothetical protein JWP44_285 [Mucilaginibacter sp.]|nr:hypothetical protein [Mucilaginibacter sp.]
MSFKQYQLIELTADINPVIKKGLKGVILEVWADDVFEVEFVKEDATNYEFKGQFTFTVSAASIKLA